MPCNRRTSSCQGSDMQDSTSGEVLIPAGCRTMQVAFQPAISSTEMGTFIAGQHWGLGG